MNAPRGRITQNDSKRERERRQVRKRVAGAQRHRHGSERRIDLLPTFGAQLRALVLDEVKLRSMNLRFELWGENLLDEEIQTAGNDFGTLGIGTINFGRMRTVGINVTAEL